MSEHPGRVNCHAHVLLPEGVFAPDNDVGVVFHPLPPPWEDDVERLVRQVARAVTARVEARGEGEEAETDVRMRDQDEAMAPAPSSSLSQPATAAHGRPRRSSSATRIHTDRLVEATGKRSSDCAAMGARSPIAHPPLSTDAQGGVVLSRRKPLRDGRAQLAFTPIEFLRRLAALIRPPRVHLTRYHGVFAPHHRHRAAVGVWTARTRRARPGVARTLRQRATAPARLGDAGETRHVLDVLVYHACGGPLRILAVLPEGEATRAILEHLGLPTTAPGPRAHGPPGGLVGSLGRLKRFCVPPRAF